MLFKADNDNFAEELQGPCNILIIRDLNIKRALLCNRQPFTAYKKLWNGIFPFHNFYVSGFGWRLRLIWSMSSCARDGRD